MLRAYQFEQINRSRVKFFIENVTHTDMLNVELEVEGDEYNQKNDKVNWWKIMTKLSLIYFQLSIIIEPAGSSKLLFVFNILVIFST